ncbi:DUF2027 domain-containing protein [Odoribacter lunatus]|uniref:DUF2027 domain-containing protein n=1 Tax=Odoribacter lunatus TaxID=2941335 RepID=UPI00203E6CE1|nr:DUF2027 domain-containing protein [Odoribacter lunatus]
MDIKIGDFVRFISEKLEGKVTSLIDRDTVNVYCEEYGFEIPANIHDLVVIKSGLSNTTAINKENTEPSSIPTEASNMLYLAIVPEDFQNLTDCRYEFHLVNDTSLICLYTINFDYEEGYSGIAAGNCDSDHCQSIGTYSRKEIDRINAITIQALLYRKGKYSHQAPVESRIKIAPASLQKNGAYKHVKWFNNMALLRPLEGFQETERKLYHLFPEPKTQKDKTLPVQPSKQPVKNVIEIDLHIQQLLDSTSGMESKDILEYQLDVFRKTLEEYKLRKGQKIVFIHGKGDGVLRQRILWELQTRYKRFQHQDASFKQYGYGATMVTVK